MFDESKGTYAGDATELFDEIMQKRIKKVYNLKLKLVVF